VANKNEMKLIGADELLKNMRIIGPKVSKKASDQGVRAALRLLKRNFKAAAPKRTGELRRSIGMRYYPRSGIGLVGLRKTGADIKAFGAGRAKVPYYYKTLEYGRKASNRQGPSPPMAPFFGKVWDRFKGSAAQTIIQEAKVALYAEATKEYQRSLRRKQRYG